VKPQDRTRAILRSKAEPSMRLLLVAIADHMNDADESWPSPSTMAEETGLAESTVMELVKAAVALGILRRWQGDYRWKVMSIAWETLAALTPKASTKGGKRTPKSPTIGDSAPVIGDTVPSDNRCPEHRSSVPGAPIIGAKGSDNRTRSDHEATREATREAPTGARGGRGLTLDGRPVPLDLLALGISPGIAIALGQSGCVDTVADLLWRSQDEVRLLPRMGPDRARAVARRCADAGFPLGCVARPTDAMPGTPPGQAPRPTRGTLASELFADDPEPAPRPNAVNTTWSEA
jgi:hypothetical protein